MSYPFAGSRMLRDLLGRKAIGIGRLHVATLMRKMSIAAIYRRKSCRAEATGVPSCH